MTLYEVLDKYQINYKRIAVGKNINLFNVGKTNVAFMINNGNVFKMTRKTYEILTSNCEDLFIVLLDSKNKKYYAIKLKLNNWLTSGFKNCDKNELFLGKQVLNYPTTLNRVITELKKMSK